MPLVRNHHEPPPLFTWKSTPPPLSASLNPWVFNFATINSHLENFGSSSSTTWWLVEVFMQAGHAVGSSFMEGDIAMQDSFERGTRRRWFGFSMLS
ncbi:hypothetical protein PM082_015471 [Marasmius tenuissimus]|nr:hypothetical protein PM082_015471 [Marasmius tenuissimus]